MVKINQVKVIESLNSLDDLTSSELAALLKFLIKKERAPSGPYLLSEQFEENQLLNTKIYNLFEKKNKILKGTLAYIQSSNIPNSVQAQASLIQAQHIPETTSITQQPIHQNVYLQSTRALTPELYNHVLPTLNKIARQDTSGEITQLSKAFLESLDISRKNKPSEKYLALLGEANFYIWTAYSLYDNLLDNPLYNPLDVSAANIFHRLAVSTYINAGLSLNKINLALNSVDRANADETSNSRLSIKDGIILISKLPTKKSLHKLLAARSSVHYIGPLELLNKTGNSAVHYRKSKSILNLYCTARQLSDDIHDWEADLTNGHISYVVCHLLKAANINDGSYDLRTLISKLQTVFWDKEMNHLVNECLKLCRDTQESYRQHLHLKPGSSFERITLKPIIDACLSAKNTIQYSKQFLQEMRT